METMVRISSWLSSIFSHSIFCFLPPSSPSPSTPFRALKCCGQGGRLGQFFKPTCWATWKKQLNILDIFFYIYKRDGGWRVGWMICNLCYKKILRVSEFHFGWQVLWEVVKLLKNLIFVPKCSDSLFLYSSFLNSTLSSLNPEETYLSSTALLGLQNIPQKLHSSPPTPAAGSPLAVVVPGANSVNLCPGGDSEKPSFSDHPGHRRRRCFYRSMLNPDTAS